MVGMRTVVLGPRPPALEAMIAERRRLGQDTFDEVWEGDHHVAPGPSFEHARVASDLLAALRPRARAAGLRGTGPFNLGHAEDFRVPAGGFHCTEQFGVWVPTAAIVVEIVSPGDETFDKFAFFAAHGVEEVIVGDPTAQRVRIWQRDPADALLETGSSSLLSVTGEELEREIDWP